MLISFKMREYVKVINMILYNLRKLIIHLLYNLSYSVYLTSGASKFDSFCMK